MGKLQVLHKSVERVQSSDLNLAQVCIVNCHSRTTCYCVLKRPWGLVRLLPPQEHNKTSPKGLQKVVFLLHVTFRLLRHFSQLLEREKSYTYSLHKSQAGCARWVGKKRLYLHKNFEKTYSMFAEYAIYKKIGLKLLKIFSLFWQNGMKNYQNVVKAVKTGTNWLQLGQKWQ